MGSIEIEVTKLGNGKLRASPIAHREDTVTWIFKGFTDEELKGLEVHSTNRVPTMAFKTGPQLGQIKDIPFPLNRKEVDDFEYVIVQVIDNKENELSWADERMGECVKHPVPPPSGSSGSPGG